MAYSFLFGGDTGETPDSLRQKRELIARMITGQEQPRNWGQGVGAVLTGLAGGIQRARADRSEAQGTQGATDAYNKVFSAFTGGSAPNQIASANIPAPGASSELAATKPGPSQQEFINALLPAAIEEGKRTGVDPRIIVAQAAQETGWGKSAPGNNYFGIKSHGKGGGQNLATHEYVDGKRVNVNDSFRAYGSPEESVRGYGDFILENPRYEGLRNADGLDAQLAALQASGYATDPNYSRSVGSIAKGIQLPQEVAALTPEAAIEAVAPQAPPQGVAQAPAVMPAQAPAPQPQQQVAQAMAGPSLEELMQLSSNPWLSDQQKTVVNTMLQQRLQEQDPMRQLQIQKLQQDLNAPAQRDTTVIDGRLVDAQTGEVVAEYQQNNDPTALMQNLEAAGIQPGTPEYRDAILKGTQNGTTVNVGEGDKFYENLDKKNAETFSALSEGGMTGRSRLAQLNNLEAIMREAPTGAGARVKLMLGDLGINTEGLSDLQATRSLLEKMVPEQRAAGSGPMSDADIAMYRRSLPDVINQPGGNELIFGTAKSIAQYDMQMGEIADMVADREISPAEGRKRIRELKNPLDGYADRARSVRGAKSEQPQAAPSGESAPTGVDPEDWKYMTPEERRLFQ